MITSIGPNRTHSWQLGHAYSGAETPCFVPRGSCAPLNILDLHIRYFMFCSAGTLKYTDPALLFFIILSIFIHLFNHSHHSDNDVFVRVFVYSEEVNKKVIEWNISAIFRRIISKRDVLYQLFSLVRMVKPLLKWFKRRGS